MEHNANVEFFVVYIHEAHALDGRAPLGGSGMPIVEEPVTMAEREEVAAVLFESEEVGSLSGKSFNVLFTQALTFVVYAMFGETSSEGASPVGLSGERAAPEAIWDVDGALGKDC